MTPLDHAATLYIDDSGTHDESVVAVASAYIVDIKQVEQFYKDWDEVRNREGFKTFHMADFEGHYDEFTDKKWTDEVKRQRTLKRLISIARIRSRYCVMVAVDKKAYTDVMLSDPELSERFGKRHYTFAVRACLDFVKKWRNFFAPNQRLRYVFDQMSKGKGEVLETFDRLKKKENVYGIVRGGFSFEGKDEVFQLQAADILAWHTYQHMCEVVLRRLPHRPAMNQIMGLPYKDGYYDRESLQNLAQHFKSLSRQKTT